MTTKNKQNSQERSEKAPRPASLMAIQEKLGLFKTRRQPKDAKNKRHDYLKNKPLGFM